MCKKTTEQQFKAIHKMVQDILNMCIWAGLNNQSTEIQGKLNFIGNSYDGFEESLKRKCGLVKEDIVRHILFEVYAQILQENIRQNNRSITMEEFLKRGGINPQEESKFNNCKKKNVLPYIKKHEYLAYDNNNGDTLSCIDFLWKRASHYRWLGQNIINAERSAIKREKRYYISEFQTYFYSYIACNYTERNKMLGKTLNLKFSKIQVEEYVEFIQGLLDNCNKSEENLNISWYLIEKEFNPILVSFLMSNGDILQKYPNIIRGFWYISLQPLLNKGVYSKIVEEKISPVNELQKRYNRDNSISTELAVLRLKRELLDPVFMLVYHCLKEKYGQGLYSLFQANKKYFSCIEKELGKDLFEAIELLKKIKSDNKCSKLFEFILKQKEDVYKVTKSLFDKLELYNDKINKWNQTNEDEDLLEAIYLKEDAKDIVDNNILLKIISGYDGKL